MVQESEYAGSLPGTNDWVNSTNIYGAADASCGTSPNTTEVVVLGLNQFTDMPDGAEITGFKVDVWWSRSDADEQLHVTLDCGSGTSTEQQFTGGGNNTNCSGVVQDSYGDSTNMWGLSTTTGDDVNDSGDVTITLRHAKVSKGGTIYVDAIQVTIYWAAIVEPTSAIDVSATTKFTVKPGTKNVGVDVAAVFDAKLTPGITSVSHYIDYVIGTWTDTDEVAGAPDGVCATTTGSSWIRCYPIPFVEIPHRARIYGIEVEVRMAISSAGLKNITCDLECEKFGSSANKEIYPLEGDCSNLRDYIFGSPIDIFGWAGTHEPSADGILYGSEISGGDFHIRLDPVGGSTETIYIDSVKVTIYFLF